MESFGKRVYFDKLTGNIIFVTNEMQGEGIKQYTLEQDREIYTALSERAIDSYEHIQLSYGEHAQEFLRGNPTSYNKEMKIFKWTLHNPVEEEKRATLEQEIEGIKAELAKKDARLADIELALIELYGGVM